MRDQVDSGKRFKTGDTIQSLPLIGNNSNNNSVSASTARLAINLAEVVRLAATTNCYIAWGDSTIEATTSDPIFPAGVEVMVVPKGATHVAFIQISAAGLISVTQLGENP